MVYFDIGSCNGKLIQWKTTRRYDSSTEGLALWRISNVPALHYDIIYQKSIIQNYISQILSDWQQQEMLLAKSVKNTIVSDSKFITSHMNKTS